ncbi:MAG: hypothetical protein IH991_03915 [Planctomycetes bacterium]|nr:hypothetical protein [Planctomycetota bacterium]
MRVLLRIIGIIWASPCTLIGLFLGAIGLCTGGRARIRGHVVEFYGGAVKWLVLRLPHGQFTLAFTLGHTVLGQSDASLDIARDHEMVHVRHKCGSVNFDALVEYGSYILRCGDCREIGVATSWCAIGPEWAGYIRVFRDDDESAEPLIEGVGSEIHEQIGDIAATGQALILRPRL